MKAQVVSFHCVLRNKLGHTISSSFNQDVINQRKKSTDNLEGLIEGLQNVRCGEKRRIVVPAARAYGAYDPSLVVEVSRTELRDGERLVVGSEVIGTLGPDKDAKHFRVVTSKRSSVVLDGNHPLAGQDLVFEIEVVSARDAVDEDFEESHATEGGTQKYLH